jgi:hypothetical protein
VADKWYHSTYVVYVYEVGHYLIGRQRSGVARRGGSVGEIGVSKGLQTLSADALVVVPDQRERAGGLVEVEVSLEGSVFRRELLLTFHKINII